MHTHHVTLDRETARDLYQKYKSHRAYEAPIDAEIRRAYQLLAQGRLIIQAAESIKQAGFDEQGRPKLAIVRADAAECWYRSSGGKDNPTGVFTTERWQRNGAASGKRIVVRPFGAGVWAVHRTLPPPIPVHLRPRRGLQNYHILWEAEWLPVPPGDPYLLRRIGRSDMWLVVAMWDLTAVERAALASRIATA